MLIENPERPHSGLRRIINDSEYRGTFSANVGNGELRGLHLWLQGLAEGEGGAWLAKEYVRDLCRGRAEYVDRAGGFLEPGEEVVLHLNGGLLPVRGG